MYDVMQTACTNIDKWQASVGLSNPYYTSYNYTHFRQNNNKYSAHNNSNHRFCSTSKNVTSEVSTVWITWNEAKMLWMCDTLQYTKYTIIINSRLAQSSNLRLKAGRIQHLKQVNTRSQWRRLRQKRDAHIFMIIFFLPVNKWKTLPLNDSTSKFLNFFYLRMSSNSFQNIFQIHSCQHETVSLVLDQCHII